MKKQRFFSLLLTLALMLSLLTGCGATSKMTESAAYDNSFEAAAQEVGAAMDTGAGNADTALTLPENRKWIITVDMSAETEDLDTLLSGLNQQIAELSGYVEDQSIYNGSTHSARRYRRASLTVRIPAEDVDSFTQQLSGIANVVSTNKSLEDVTLQYTDTQTRITALETEQARLLELMEAAETMADLLEIEARLTDVRYELESYTSRLRLYDNQIDYATIYLSIDEVQEYTPVEPTVWERISGGFRSSLKGLGTGLVDLLVWVLANLPYILVYGGICVGLFFLLRRHHKRRKAKKNAE